MSPREVGQKQVPGKGKDLILITIERVVFLICFYTYYFVIGEKLVFHLKKNVLLVKRFERR